MSPRNLFDILSKTRSSDIVNGMSKNFKVLFSIHVTNMLAHSVAKPFFNLLKSAKSLLSQQAVWVNSIDMPMLNSTPKLM